MYSHLHSLYVRVPAHTCVPVPPALFARKEPQRAWALKSVPVRTAAGEDIRHREGVWLLRAGGARKVKMRAERDDAGAMDRDESMW